MHAAATLPEIRAGRVLIVDDSAVARAVLSRVIGEVGAFEVAGAVPTAAAALAFLARTRVDIVLLDIQMPGVDGLTALPDLLTAGRGAKVLVVSSAAGQGATATLQALALGAADTLVKPAPGERAQRFEAALIDKLDRLHQSTAAAVIPQPAIGRSAAPVPLGPAGDAFDLIAIGASTGGIHALSLLLGAVPGEMTLPILVTQHLPASFMPYFAAQLSTLAKRPCEVAADRSRIRPGRIYVAPGDAHLRCVSLGDGGGAIRLSSEPAGSGCLPSADPMFESVAACYGARALGVVLSGMGRDGAEGARHLAAAGACILAQDQASSVVWGMPGAVAAAGFATALLEPRAIGQLIATRKRQLC